MVDQDMIKRIHRMALRTWDVIGGDILSLLKEEGKPQVVSKKDVVDTVCDADYMMYHGNDKEAYVYWEHLPDIKKIEIVSEAFVYKNYGW